MSEENIIESKIKRPLSAGEIEQFKTYIKDPLIYTNSQLIKNKFKNDIFANSKELTGILLKDAYTQDYKKIDYTITYNDFKTTDLSDKSDIILNLYAQCLLNNYNLDFTECIDYDIEVPEIDTDIYCKRCKSKNIIPVEEHKRSADEASEYFLRCKDCKNKFFF